jgi:hypothetical protein
MGVNLAQLPKEAEHELIGELFKVWSDRLKRNRIKTTYYEAKNQLQDLGISIPPQLTEVNTVVGWPAKAVDGLAIRSIFDGFVTRDGQTELLSDVLRENDFANMYVAITPSELTHSCAFLTVSRGGRGEPAVVISGYSALKASAIWDYRKKRIRAGMAIVDADSYGNLTAFNIYTDTDTVEYTLSDKNIWQRVAHPHTQGRPLMEPLRYRPSIDRPFGKSRISRAVIYLTDSAMRTALRAEVTAEFFTAPMRYLMGVSEEVVDSIENQRWKAYLGNFFAVTDNEDGKTPTIGQLPQQSMQPHLDQLRSLAMQFAGETGIPVSSLGIIQDNPSSAEAIHAGREDLIIEAEALNATNGASLRNIGLMVLAIAQNKSIDELDDNAKTLMPIFRRPDRPSASSQADAIVKQVSAIPWLAETTVALEELGYSEEKRTRMLSDKAKAEGRKTLEGALDVYRGRVSRGEI